MRVLGYLSGLSFPVTTSVLVEHLRNEGAPEDVVATFERLDGHVFTDRVEVAEHVWV
jgi:hypothetical protein